MLREQVLCPFQIQTNQRVSCCWRTLELIESVKIEQWSDYPQYSVQEYWYLDLSN